MSIHDEENWGINAVCQVSNDMIATAGNDAKIKLWNWKTGDLQKTLIGHGNPIRCLVMVKMGELLASGSDSSEGRCSIKVWRIKDSAILITLKEHEQTVNELLMYDPETMISASFDSTLRVWKWRLGQCIRVLTGHTFAVLSMCLIEDIYLEPLEKKHHQPQNVLTSSVQHIHNMGAKGPHAANQYSTIPQQPA